MNRAPTITVAGPYDSVLAAIWMLGPRASVRRITAALEHHEYFVQLSPSAREMEVQDQIAALQEALAIAPRGLIRRRYLLRRRGVQRLNSPLHPCCAQRGPCWCPFS